MDEDARIVDKSVSIETSKLLNKYGKLISKGTEEQLKQLIRYDGEKSGWDDIYIHYAIEKLSEKLEKLKEAGGALDILKVVEESAHIANFAHMIIYKGKNLINDICNEHLWNTE